MSAKHTPGPWCIGKMNSVYCGHQPIAFTAFPYKINEAKEPGESWLEMRIRTDPERDARDAVQLQNARLIAAAPELMESLEDAVEWLANGDETDAQKADELQAVIAKAKGGSND